MIVATRPDPTVRPPSRYFNPVLSHIFYAFLSKIQRKTDNLHHVFLFAQFLGTGRPGRKDSLPRLTDATLPTLYCTGNF